MQEEQFADITHQRRRQGEEKMPSFLTQWSMPKKETAKNTNKAVKKRSWQTGILYIFIMMHGHSLCIIIALCKYIRITKNILKSPM